MATVDILEAQLSRMATLMETIKTPTYNTNVVFVDWQHKQRREEQLPAILLKSSGEQFFDHPAGLTRCVHTYTVTCALKIDIKSEDRYILNSKLLDFRKDFVKAFGSDRYLSASLVDHVIQDIRDFEGFFFPKGLFVARMQATYQYTGGNREVTI